VTESDPAPLTIEDGHGNWCCVHFRTNDDGDEA